MNLVFNSTQDAYDYFYYHGFEPVGNDGDWVYRKANDRSSRLDNWFDPIASRKTEGKVQHFGIRPIPQGRVR